jgi:hypothetical protein
VRLLRKESDKKRNRGQKGNDVSVRRKKRPRNFKSG